jgi:hypothetical protein
MAYNLVVAYDLNSPGQNYEAVQAKIKSLGRWYKLQYSLFYLHSALDAQQVHDAVRGAMDANDKLTVVDAKNAVISPISQTDLAAINALWVGQRAA